MRAIIVGGGIPPQKSLIKRYMSGEHIILAADSGADIVDKYDIEPDYLLGDFDSINGEVLEKLTKGVKTTKLPREKDFTDTHIAVLNAINMGAKEIVLLGCTGKRIDHFMANLCLLKVMLEYGVSGCIVDEMNEIYLIDKSSSINGEIGQVFSLFSYCEDTIGLTIEGAKYPLENYNLQQGDNLTVSNEFLKEQVEVIFERGSLLVFKDL
ncbi:MAG: thiamine diphosphokinase [Clostridium sp.]